MEEKQGLFSKLGQWGPFAGIAEHIRNKLLLAFLLVSLIPLAVTGVVAYVTASNSLDAKSIDQLESVETIKAGQIQTWFLERRGDAKVMSENPFTLAATEELLAAIVELGGGDHEQGAIAARNLYLNQPELSNANDGSTFSEAHGIYDPVFKEYVSTYGYYDMFLIDKDGDIVYTTHKEDDFATNVADGLYSDSGLGLAFTDALQGTVSDYTVITDFDGYAPSGGLPASFIASPIFSQGEAGGELIGVLAFQIPIDNMNAIMQENTGLGETGETYLVGSNHLWRSGSRFIEESTILNPDYTADTPTINDALAGNHSNGIVEDYRGTTVLSSWGPLVIQEPTTTIPEGVTWAFMADIDEAEVQQPVQQMALIIGGVVVAALVIIVIVAIVVSGGLTAQIDKITEMFAMVGMGDFDARAEVVSRDELGEMAFSLNAMLDNTLTLIQSSEEREQMQDSIMKLLEEIAGVADRDLTVEAEVTADMTGAIADSFNMMIIQLREIISGVQDTTLQVSASANEVQATTEHLAIGSEEQASQIVDTSAALDEMAVSIQQVSENAALSATVSEQSTANARTGSESVQNTIEGMGRIREQVQETSKRIKRLGESSQEIGEIVQLIGDIADRTSILALNASIQAAMAGDAGRGFAVVAEEVERLAERSTEATKQIDNLIRTIQNETYEAVAAMETMTNEVVSGSDLAQEAGTALHEIETVSVRLSDLIQQISLASKQQARGSETIARSMNDIAEVTQQTAAGTKQAAVSISNLSVLADDLRGSVSTFKIPNQNGSNGTHSDDEYSLN